MRSRFVTFARAGRLGLAAAALALAVAVAAQPVHTAPAPAAGTSASSAAAVPGKLPPGTEWAAWINRDIEIDLQNLPKAYSCDELWYKLRAILLEIGAREYMAITPYDCGKGAPNGGRSPTLHLRFQTLRPVTGKDIYWANTRAKNEKVELAPGEPKRLDAGDCALVKQLQGTLLAYLDTPVDAARFECAAPPSTRDFDLSVRALRQWPQKVAAD